MSSGIFYRNIRARDQLELFLLSAASSLLLVRFYLHITGYPQIATGGLHIAHMLWGGILMMIAIATAISFLGVRAMRIAAIVGGIGFGVFIDELGKFITRDNNYFYQPAIGIIYAVFIALYLLFSFVSRNRPLTSREYQLNALAQMEEAVVRDMNPVEKAQVQQLLEQADTKDPLTHHLLMMLSGVKTIPTKQPRYLTRLKRKVERQYEAFWHRKDSELLVRSFFIAEVALFVGAVSWSVYSNINGIVDLFSGNIT
ncbi:MAG TPA: hypothetical protein VD735_01535, partial [Candidatus Saccharimonadales bacterium]|nr:hypothetical protein [Candidatus Saccharimonadales bacterium]